MPWQPGPPALHGGLQAEPARIFSLASLHVCPYVGGEVRSGGCWWEMMILVPGMGLSPCHSRRHGGSNTRVCVFVFTHSFNTVLLRAFPPPGWYAMCFVWVTQSFAL